MTDCEQITMEQVNAWHYVNMSHLTDEEFNCMITWLEQQPGDRFYWSLIGQFWFESEHDRMMCVISWS